MYVKMCIPVYEHKWVGHTLAVTKAGTLWSWGGGDKGKLGHNHENNRLVPTQVEAQHFIHAKIVSAAAGETHSAATTWRTLHMGRGNACGG